MQIYSFFKVLPITRRTSYTNRGETRALIGGGGEYSYIRVLPHEFLLKLTLMTADFKRNFVGQNKKI